MKLKDIINQLANRINQPHVIEVYLRQVYAKGFVNGTKKSPWINVKERLPEENTSVFFAVEWNALHKVGYFVGLYSGNGCWESDYKIFLPDSPVVHVTHWMSMPSFDEILETNRDVLERIKEKGD